LHILKQWQLSFSPKTQIQKLYQFISMKFTNV